MSRWLILLTGLMMLPATANAASLSGRILLDVQNNGEAWYVSPVNDHRYFLNRPDDAFNIMRTLGLGISNSDLNRFDVDPSLRARLAGRILLQVESHGEAYYIDPVTLSKNYLGRPADAFKIMSDFGLGITRQDLSSILVSGAIQVPDMTGSVQITGVPFTSQAPLGEWEDERQQEGCEEASIMMAMYWVRGDYFIASEARDEIIKISDWEKEKYGVYHDTSAKDTYNNILKDYFGYHNARLEYDISTNDILAELLEGNLVVVPINGRAIGNPFFKQPGPERHMAVVTGFDASTNEFILNDPGTSKGQNMRFKSSVLQNSLRDYNSGYHAPIGSGRTAMIVIRK